MGRLIPAGTGFPYYRNVILKTEQAVKEEKEAEAQIQS